MRTRKLPYSARRLWVVIAANLKSYACGQARQLSAEIALLTHTQRVGDRVKGRGIQALAAPWRDQPFSNATGLPLDLRLRAFRTMLRTTRTTWNNNKKIFLKSGGLVRKCFLGLAGTPLDLRHCWFGTLFRTTRTTWNNQKKIELLKSGGLSRKTVFYLFQLYLEHWRYIFLDQFRTNLKQSGAILNIFIFRKWGANFTDIASSPKHILQR